VVRDGPVVRLPYTHPGTGRLAARHGTSCAGPLWGIVGLLSPEAEERTLIGSKEDSMMFHVKHTNRFCAALHERICTEDKRSIRTAGFSD